MFHDWTTQLIKFSDQQKGTESATATSYRPDKNKIKKKHWKVGITVSKNTLQYK